MFFRHQWSEQEINNCYRNAYNQEVTNDSRFISSLLFPFIGGLIIGGLFIPQPNSFQQTPQPMIVPPPYPYPYYQIPLEYGENKPPIYPYY